jgi:hypothetical protein
VLVDDSMASVKSSSYPLPPPYHHNPNNYFQAQRGLIDESMKSDGFISTENIYNNSSNNPAIDDYDKLMWCSEVSSNSNPHTPSPDNSNNNNNLSTNIAELDGLDINEYKLSGAADQETCCPLCKQICPGSDEIMQQLCAP